MLGKWQNHSCHLLTKSESRKRRIPVKLPTLIRNPPLTTF